MVIRRESITGDIIVIVYVGSGLVKNNLITTENWTFVTMAAKPIRVDSITGVWTYLLSVIV